MKNLAIFIILFIIGFNTQAQIGTYFIKGMSVDSIVDGNLTNNDLGIDNGVVKITNGITTILKSGDSYDFMFKELIADEDKQDKKGKDYHYVEYTTFDIDAIVCTFMIKDYGIDDLYIQLYWVDRLFTFHVDKK